MGGLHAKSMTSQRYRATYKMADMRYYGNVMTTTRWRLYVILHLQQYSRRLNWFFFNNVVLARNTVQSDCYIRTQQCPSSRPLSHSVAHVTLILPSVHGYGHFWAETDRCPVTSHGKLLNFFIALVMSASHWWGRGGGVASSAA